MILIAIALNLTERGAKLIAELLADLLKGSRFQSVQIHVFRHSFKFPIQNTLLTLHRARCARSEIDFSNMCSPSMASVLEGTCRATTGKGAASVTRTEKFES